MMHILLSDDHVLFRAGLIRILKEKFLNASFEEVSTCPELFKKIQEKEWDLLILDISMRGQNSLNLLPDIKKIRPKLPIIVLSMYEERPFVIRALREGALAYLTKERASDELFRAIDAVWSGRRYLPENIATQIADHLALKKPERPHETLSPREYEIFLLLSQAQSVSQIAEKLGLSPKTVSTHRIRILEKMGLRSNHELMHYAVTHSLSQPPL
ncbi:MAG: response regulator transcription factor [Deltaproteobacteria bacterium]|nr:response regulator transcription factor [Deltaproteobacteria bacterium]